MFKLYFLVCLVRISYPFLFFKSDISFNEKLFYVLFYNYNTMGKKERKKHRHMDLFFLLLVLFTYLINMFFVLIEEVAS